MPEETQPQILNKTLGEVLQNNTHAQGMVMQAMQINPQQLQQLLNLTGNNQLMNMTIGDLFKNGVVQQAAAVNPAAPLNSNGSIRQPVTIPVGFIASQPAQISPQQMQQLMGIFQNGQITQTTPQSDTVPYNLPAAQPKPTFFQKIKDLFK